MGINTADDAGVFLVQDGLALVQTVDLLTPMVDDPYTFGRIAAANSLSDVYAMGGEPLTTLNIAGFPAPAPKEWLAEILEGGQDAVIEAGAVPVGGHTFNEKEIKYGLAVTGQIRPDRIVTNAGARAGNVLVLTKPLGTGTFAQALLTREEVAPELYQSAVRSMTSLNRAAAEVMKDCDATAATDVTGFGLLGHAQEMAEASRVEIRIDFGTIPFLPKVRELAAEGVVDAGVPMNETAFKDKVALDEGISEAERNLLWASESSGGLFVAIPERCADRLLRAASDLGVEAAAVGQVVAGQAGRVQVTR